MSFAMKLQASSSLILRIQIWSVRIATGNLEHSIDKPSLSLTDSYFQGYFYTTIPIENGSIQGLEIELYKVITLFSERKKTNSN